MPLLQTPCACDAPTVHICRNLLPHVLNNKAHLSVCIGLHSPKIVAIVLFNHLLDKLRIRTPTYIAEISPADFCALRSQYVLSHLHMYLKPSTWDRCLSTEVLGDTVHGIESRHLEFD